MGIYNMTEMTFTKVTTGLGTSEAIEAGVEYLLKDVRDSTCHTLTEKTINNLNCLWGLAARLGKIQKYLSYIITRKIPVNHRILFKLQNTFNSYPSLLANRI